MKKNLLILLLLFFIPVFNASAFATDKENPALIYNQAIDLYKQDNVEGSIDLFKKAIELKPDFYEAHYNLAQILMSVDRNEEALKSLEILLSMNNNDTETLYNIGKIQYKRGYLSNSYKHLVAIPESAPQYASAKILIDKIEKRQEELKLEAIIKEHKNLTDNSGKALYADISQMQAPSGISVDSEGNIYCASFAENSIYKISIFGKKTVFTNSSLIKGPIGIAADSKNNIYIANYSANNIVKVTPSGAASVFAEVQKPYCILYDEKHDRLYITEQNTNKIVKIDL